MSSIFIMASCLRAVCITLTIVYLKSSFQFLESLHNVTAADAVAVVVHIDISHDVYRHYAKLFPIIMNKA